MTKAGNLLSARIGHGAIFDGSTILVVGGKAAKGDGPFPTEKCNIVDKVMTCVQQSPELQEFAYYPELFLVPINYCKNYD